MGNGSSKKKAKIMKIDGETFKMKLPATTMDVLKDYPGHVLLESKTVKRYGIRAPELKPDDEIRPGKVYFLVEMPKFPELRSRRSRSMAERRSGAEERLEGLMLRRQKSSALEMGSGSGYGSVRVKLRIPRIEIEKMMRESKDEGEVTERILDLCLQNSSSRSAIFTH